MSRRRVVPALSVVGLLALAGCGGNALSPQALRTRATRICAQAVRSSDRIPLPASTAGGAAFLAQGIAIFGPELERLRRLVAPPKLAGAYRVALADSKQQLDALVASDHNLRAGGDPVVTVKLLDVELGPIDTRDQASWRAVGAPACANLSGRR